MLDVLGDPSPDAETEPDHADLHLEYLATFGSAYHVSAYQQPTTQGFPRVYEFYKPPQHEHGKAKERDRIMLRIEDESDQPPRRESVVLTHNQFKPNPVLVRELLDFITELAKNMPPVEPLEYTDE